MSTTQPSSILVVNAHPQNFKSLYSCLQESGFQVLVVKTGESCLKKLQTLSPDLILLDVMLPGINGFETCRRLKAAARTKDIPAIFVTAFSDSMDKIKALKVGAVDYITLPFAPEEFIARIENQIKSGQLQKQLAEHNQRLQKEIVEMAKATEALQQSQSLLGDVLNSSLDGIAALAAIRDSQGKIIDFKWLLLNPAAEKLVGRPESELAGKQLLMERPGDLETDLFDRYVRVVETGEPLQTEIYYSHKTIQAWLFIVAVKLGDGLTVTFRDITDRKQTESALKESEAQFRGIFENAAIGIGLTDADSRLIKANPTLEAFLGYNEAEMLSQDFANITHPEDQTIDLSLTQEVINGSRDSFQIEKRYIRKNGELFWGRLTVSAVRNLAGEFQFTVAILEDINDRKLREMALKESERRFRAIFNNAFQFTGLLTPDGTLIEANQTALDFADIQHVDIVGRPFWDALWWREEAEEAGEEKVISLNANPYKKSKSQAELTNIVPLICYSPAASVPLSPKQTQLKEAIARAANGELVRYEVDVRGAGDRVATIDFSLKPVRDDAGNVVLVIPEGRDITERKKAEERLRLLESVVVNVNEAVLITEAEPIGFPGPKIIYVNEAFTRMTGYLPQEVIGKTPRLLHGEKTDRNQLRRIRQALQGWQSVRVEVINYRKDGSEFWVEFEMVPVADETGRFTHLVSVQRDITERKKAQEDLLMAQQRLEYLLSSSPSIIYSCQTTKPYSTTFISENVTAVLGYKPREFIKDKNFWIDHIHPEDTERVFAEFPQIFEVGHCACEYRFLDKQGTYRWLYDAVKLVLDEHGNPIEMIGSWIDITQRKQVEAALQESQRWLSAMAEANPNILYVYDLIEERIIYCNREMFPILGYTPQEVEQMGAAFLFTVMHPEDILAFPTHLQQFQTAQEGDICEREYRMRHKNGEWRWLYGRETIFARTSDSQPWLILGTTTDISDRKQAELELTMAKAALEQQLQRILLQEKITQEIRSRLKPEQFFQTAATQIGQAFHVDRCLVHIYVESPIPRIPLVAEYRAPGIEWPWSLDVPVVGNPHAQLMLSQDSAIACADVDQEPLLAEALSACHQLGLKSMLGVRTSYQGKANGLIGVHQYYCQRQWTDWEIALLESVAAQLGIAIAQASLLTQEKQRRRELATQNQALAKAKLDAEAANHAKSQFLSKMSHELRTPLNAILGFSQVMVRDRSLATEQKEYLEIINRSGEHLLALINDILSMSKIEAGQVTLYENCFDLYRLLDSIKEMLQIKASSKGLQLIFERTPDVPQYIQTDERKLRQVLINLLGNALKFTKTGSVTLRLGLGTGEWTMEKLHNQQPQTNHQPPTTNHQPPTTNNHQPTTNHHQPTTNHHQPTTNHHQPTTISFEVADTGPGISPEELGNLFDPFVQTQTGRQSMEGTGLGLAISQQYVRLMGGNITVSSVLNQGTIFTFDIQVSLATSADEKSISYQKRIVGLEPNQPSYRILIVEDVPENRQLLVKFLEPLGFEIRTAVNGQEGVALWESWSPHLIWMDILMPVMDGYEATRQIKRTPKGQKTIIIALTASAFEEQREAILRAGCDDFIPKPCQENVLLEKMAHYLGIRYLYEEQQASTSSGETSHQNVSREELTPEVLAFMPTPWVAQLHQAALYADDELMNQLIEQIPSEHSSLRHSLRELIDNFRLDQLIDLTEGQGSGHDSKFV